MKPRTAIAGAFLSFSLPEWSMEIVSCKPTITRKDLEGVLDCLINDELVKGDSVKAFEQSLCELTGYRHAAVLTSPTAAYHCAFKALDVNAESEIIMPSYFAAAPLNALAITGGKAVLVDNGEDSLVPDIEEIKSKITDKTRAIIISHLTGVSQSLESIKEAGIPIIEDISHFIGAETVEKGQNIASFSIASFTPYDMITTGNGAAVFTNNTRHYALFKEMRHNETGVYSDYMITDFQAAMGISQISRLQDFIRRRREIARVYYDSLRHTPHKAIYHFSEQFTYQSFPVIFDVSSEKVEKYWKKSGIEIYHPVPQPLHLISGFKGLDYPRSDRYAKKVYSLPIYPTLTRKEIEKISRSLAKFI
jgi:dTDP-4-amino-4,6-dideoxygalactose transaminase